MDRQCSMAPSSQPDLALVVACSPHRLASCGVLCSGPAQLPACASQPSPATFSPPFSDQAVEEALREAIEIGEAALLRGDSAADLDAVIDESGKAALGQHLWEAAFADIVKNVVKHSIFLILRPLPSGPQAVPTYIARNCDLIDEFFPDENLPDAALLLGEPDGLPCERIAVRHASLAGIAGLKHGRGPAALITLIEMEGGLMLHNDVSQGIRKWRSSPTHKDMVEYLLGMPEPAIALWNPPIPSMRCGVVSCSSVLRI